MIKKAKVWILIYYYNNTSYCCGYGLTAYLLVTDNEFYEKLTTMRSHDRITQQQQHIITYLIK